MTGLDERTEQPPADDLGGAGRAGPSIWPAVEERVSS